MQIPEPQLSQTPKDQVADMPHGRYDTLCETMRLVSIHPTIVEVGTSHNPKGKLTDGWATLAFAKRAAQLDGQLIVVDNDPEAIAFAKDLVAPYTDHVVFFEKDVFELFCDVTVWQNAGVEVPSYVDLMYFDAWLSPYTDLDGTQKDGPEAYCDLWREAQLRFNWINYLLIDDTHRPGKSFSGPSNTEVGGPGHISGKGAKLIEQLVEGDYMDIVFFEKGQVLLEKRQDMRHTEQL